MMEVSIIFLGYLHHTITEDVYILGDVYFLYYYPLEEFEVETFLQQDNFYRFQNYSRTKEDLLY